MKQNNFVFSQNCTKYPFTIIPHVLPTCNSYHSACWFQHSTSKSTALPSTFGKSSKYLFQSQTLDNWMCYCNGKCAHIAGKPAESYHSCNRARKFWDFSALSPLTENVSSCIIAFTNLLYFFYFMNIFLNVVL